MKAFLSMQIAMSTAQESRNYFTGVVKQIDVKQFVSSMPAGKYRVIDGQLYAVLPSVDARADNNSNK